MTPDERFRGPLASSPPEPDGDGRPSDLQDALEALAAGLRQAESRYRQIFDRNPLPMWIYERDTLRFLEVNEAAVKRYGYSAQEFLAMTLRDIRPDEDVPALEALVPRIKPGLVTSGEWRHRAKDGSIIQVSIHSHDIDLDGRPARLVLAEDITDRKAAEDRLRTSEEQFRAMTATVIDAIVLMDAQGRISFFNEAAERMFGYSAADVQGRSLAEVLVPKRFRDRHAGALPHFVATGQGAAVGRTVELSALRKDGSELHVELSLSSCRLHDEWHAVGVIRDLTERKQAEVEREKLREQLQHAQKMESVGRLAGGVAHDFNNMLQTIIGNAQLARGDAPDAARMLEHLAEIEKAAVRSADLTRQLLAFARRQTVSPRTLDLNDTVGGLLKMLRRLIGEDIQLSWRPGAGVWPVTIDPAQLDQVLANLTVNARDAIGGVGTITIGTANLTQDRVPDSGRSDSPREDYVLLSVGDTGRGMDQYTRDHLFEPFFTTKGVGEGTGLGLATVYGIVTQNQGFIRVESEPGRGATFNIYLPRASAPVTASAPRVETRSPRGTETVLLVEDEEQILELGLNILRRHGYTVLGARTPGEALEQAARYPEPIHLLLTDVVMPGMNGRELRDRIALLRPRVRCLFISGYTAEIVSRQGVLLGDVHLLHKPFSVADLTLKVREVLDAGATGTSSP